MGSTELKESLPRGVLKHISETFGYKSYTWVGRVVSGKEKGDAKIIECASRIAAAYKASGFEEQKEKILKEYESNQTRKESGAFNCQRVL
ncbi:hypothetical protein [Tenacibaculum sp. nBUS_03]|uniref:hypothetical protein n=1 Tax=Tenacibaculum sp. nBUS_03 TaxID=3395320 RepID=UPI003EB8CA38